MLVANGSRGAALASDPANAALRTLGKLLVTPTLAALTLLAATGFARAAQFDIEYKPNAPLRTGSGISIVLDASGRPNLTYSRDIDLDGALRHAWKDGGEWHFSQVVDRAGAHTSLGLSKGTVYLSYQDLLAQDLYFGYQDGSVWQTELVDNAFPIEGLYSSLAFEANGSPHIAYHEASGANNAKHAFYVGSWVPEIADGFATTKLRGRYTSLAIGPNDSMFVSHIGDRDFVSRLLLRLSSRNDSEWVSIEVDTTITGRGGTAVAVLSTGQPVIAFVGSPSTAEDVLYYARRLTYTTWAITAIDTVDVESDVALRIDALGQAHVVYQNDGTLMHAYDDILDGWLTEVVDAVETRVRDLDMVIDANDVLHVAYQGGEQYPPSITEIIHYAVGTFGDWAVERVEGGDDEGLYLSMTTTSAGEPVIAYYDGTTRSTQISRRVEANAWSDDDITLDGKAGRFATIVPRVVSANSGAVVYFDDTNEEIVRRSGFYDAWAQALAIETGPGVASLSCADSSTFSIVAYYDSIAGDVSVIRFGPGTPSVVPVDQTGDVGRGCSVGITIDGVVHVLYYDETNSRLQHARSSDSGWTIGTVASGPGVGWQSSLRTKGLGVRAAYYDADQRDLNWAIWDGSSWTTGLVDSTGDVGRTCSVALDGAGDMGISYYDATNSDLKYARLLNGGNVSEISVVDATGDVGRTSATLIRVSTGRARIAYYDATLRQIKYAEEVPASTAVPGLSDLGVPRFRVMPSPAIAGKELRVFAGVVPKERAELELFDVAGRSLARMPGVEIGGDTPPIRIGIPPDAVGVLFLRIRLESGREATARAVVIR